jgi:hypothetical protein
MRPGIGFNGGPVNTVMNVRVFTYGGESTNHLSDCYLLTNDYEACIYFSYRTEEIKEFLINCVEFFCNTKNRPEIKMGFTQPNSQ